MKLLPQPPSHWVSPCPAAVPCALGVCADGSWLRAGFLLVDVENNPEWKELVSSVADTWLN